MAHHPGVFVSKANLGPSDVPWALTTHLLSISIPQFKRTTTAPFLARAAQGTLPKPLIAQWLANDRLYIQGYISLASSLVAVVKQSTNASTLANPETIESRLLQWLNAGIENVRRELAWFDEMTTSYDLHSPSPAKSLGLQRFEALFSQLSSQHPSAFLPWLEGAVCLFSTEKVYYEAWSWARKQDRRRSTSPPEGASKHRSAPDYSRDLDGGAMRKEFIPNWSNKNFMMFVETLERIINEGVSQAVAGDDGRWQEVKERADAVWQATLDAEEAFWPDVEGQGNDGAEIRGLAGAKEGSLLEPNKQAYGESGRGDATRDVRGMYVPHLDEV